MKLVEIISMIQSLIEKINARTGKDDKTLAEAVDRVTSGNMVDTSDGNAVASDMANTKIAYVKGRRVTGNLSVYGHSALKFKQFDDYPLSKAIHAVGICTDKRIISANSTAVVPINYDEFGDATEEDVTAGKTFTSAAGLKKTGTAETFKRKTGTVEIAGDTSSFEIDTGLSTIDMIVVKKDSPGDKETYFWAGESVLTCICATGVNYIYNLTKLEIIGGKAKCQGYTTSFPIKAGTFKWVAYGS